MMSSLPSDASNDAAASPNIMSTTTPSKDTGSVASSTLASGASSNWSASFRVRFPFFWDDTGNTEVVYQDAADTTMVEETKKQHEILSCLNGSTTTTDDDEQVDLWKLRELATSRGGLLTSAIRKRAWPKLMGAHQQVLWHASNKQRHNVVVFVDISRSDYERMERDVQQTTWSIEDNVRMAQQLQHYQDQQERLALKKKTNVKSVTFASSPPPKLKPDGSPNSDTSSDDGPPVDSITTLTKKLHQDDDEDDTTVQSPMSGGSGMISPNSSFSTLGSPPRHGLLRASTMKHVQRFKSKPQEQQILINVLTSVLRTPPEKQDSFLDDDDDNRLHYYSGLHDLTALLLINLESPSLTSLVLTKLASFHLRDAMRGGNSQQQHYHLGYALQLSVKPLLQYFDVELHHFIFVEANVEMPSFCLQWIKTWLAQDVVADVRIASRLVDVFLVSHAMMPIYVVVAMLSHPVNRRRILKTQPELKSIHSVLKNLPVDMMMQQAVDDDVPHNEFLMNVFEDLIETAVEYMGQVPPPVLLELARTYRKGKLHLALSQVAPTITMLQHPPPAWAIASYAPTDYALLQQAKNMRKGAVKQQQQGEQELNGEDYSSCSTMSLERARKLYPAAVNASGMGNGGGFGSAMSRRRRRRVVALLVLILGAVAVSLTAFGEGGASIRKLLLLPKTAPEVATTPTTVVSRSSKSKPNARSSDSKLTTTAVKKTPPSSTNRRTAQQMAATMMTTTLQKKTPAVSSTSSSSAQQDKAKKQKAVVKMTIPKKVTTPAASTTTMMQKKTVSRTKPKSSRAEDKVVTSMSTQTMTRTAEAVVHKKPQVSNNSKQPVVVDHHTHSLLERMLPKTTTVVVEEPKHDVKKKKKHPILRNIGRGLKKIFHRRRKGGKPLDTKVDDDKPKNPVLRKLHSLFQRHGQKDKTDNMPKKKKKGLFRFFKRRHHHAEEEPRKEKKRFFFGLFGKKQSKK